MTPNSLPVYIVTSGNEYVILCPHKRRKPSQVYKLPEGVPTTGNPYLVYGAACEEFLGVSKMSLHYVVSRVTSGGL